MWQFHVGVINYNYLKLETSMKAIFRIISFRIFFRFDIWIDQHYYYYLPFEHFKEKEHELNVPFVSAVELQAVKVCIITEFEKKK
jgi:hypothetical protein